jgi:hypothetical protein
MHDDIPQLDSTDIICVPTVPRHRGNGYNYRVLRKILEL